MKAWIIMLMIALGIYSSIHLFNYYAFMYDNAYIDRRSSDKTVALEESVGLTSTNPNLIRNGSELILMFYLMDNIERDVTWFKINNAAPFEVTPEWLLVKSSKVRQLYDVSGPYKLGSYLDMPVTFYLTKYDTANNRYYIEIKIGV